MQSRTLRASTEVTDRPSRPDGPGAPASRAIAGRLFVVGCPRSGTTLLQSFLAAHPAVRSFPETAVFGRLLGGGVMRSFRADPSGDWAAVGESGQLRLGRGVMRSFRAGPSGDWTTVNEAGQARLGSIHRRAQLAYRHARELLDTLGRRDLEQILPIRSNSTGQFAEGFVGVLDRLALDQGKSWWVEKTPGHLRFVREILGLVPGARFINILRDGRQNVAALYDMARQYPDRWWVRYRDLDNAIERWNISVRHTRRLLDVPDVLLVRYERLVAETAAVAEEVCRFAGLPFSRDMIDRRAEAASTVVTAGEPWKADVLTPMRSSAPDKFNELFDAEQKAYIESRLERIDF